MTALKLETRKRSDIDNAHITDAVIPGEEMAAQGLKVKFISAVHRPTPVCHTYNCHGLTFGSRRTAITSSSEIRKILTEDDYEAIQLEAVLPGDVAVYIDESGAIEHSGIVVEARSDMLVKNPLVLSKWGSAHEVIHRVRDCPYLGRVEYYRVTK